MINPQELRIGNIVYAHPDNPNYYQLKSFNEGIGHIADGAMIFLKDAVGVPLSPELLEKLGFEMEEGYYKKGDLSIDAYHAAEDGYVVYKGEELLTTVDAVHELQNLYYWLHFKEELEVNL